MENNMLALTFLAIDLLGAAIAWSVVRRCGQRRSFDHAVALFFSASLMLSWAQAVLGDLMFFESLGYLIYNGMSLNWLAAKVVLIYLCAQDLARCRKSSEVKYG